MKRKNIVLALCLMLLMLFVGCGKEVAVEEPAPSTSEVVSEEVSEPVSEPISEEVVSEEVSEETEIVDGVQMVYYENYAELSAYLESLEEPVVLVYNFNYSDKGQAILYDGAHYTVEEEFAVNVKTSGNVSGMHSTAENVRINNYDIEGIDIWSIVNGTTCVDMEIPIVITYEDGSEENITVYITKEWEG